MSARHVGAVLLLVLSVTACTRAPKPAKEYPEEVASTVAERDMTLEDIKQELWHAGQRTFRSSTLMERHMVSEIVATLLARAESGDADLGRLSAKATRVGFRIEVWRFEGRLFWALLEREGQRRGAGAYVVRVSGPTLSHMQVLLKAPHAYYDIGTGDIAARLFFGGHIDARALFTNTVHRYWDANGDHEAREDSLADVCHRVDHLFQYATDTAARVLGELVVVQLHGFAGSEARPDAIISAGDAYGSTPLVYALQQKIGDFFGVTKRFPEETEELGGTTNAQGYMLQNHRHAHFVHVELSKRVREQLRDSEDALARFGRMLTWDSLDARPGGGAVR